MLEGQLTWLVHIIGAVVRGRMNTTGEEGARRAQHAQHAQRDSKPARSGAARQLAFGHLGAAGQGFAVHRPVALLPSSPRQGLHRLPLRVQVQTRRKQWMGTLRRACLACCGW